MRKLLQKIYETKIGKWFLRIVICVIVIPIYYTGVAIYYTSKLIRTTGFLLMFSFNSAKEELTDWRISLNIKDVL